LSDKLTSETGALSGRNVVRVDIPVSHVDAGEWFAIGVNPFRDPLTYQVLDRLPCLDTVAMMEKRE